MHSTTRDISLRERERDVPRVNDRKLKSRDERDDGSSAISSGRMESYDVRNARKKIYLPRDIVGGDEISRVNVV